VRCDKRVVEPAAKAKKGKGVAVEEVQDEWEVELLDTGQSGFLLHRSNAADTSSY
jgi:hypothetical protein